jgi:hypothetical protein
LVSDHFSTSFASEKKLKNYLFLISLKVLYNGFVDQHRFWFSKLFFLILLLFFNLRRESALPLLHALHLDRHVMPTNEVSFHMDSHALLAGPAQTGNSFEEVRAEQEILALVASGAESDGQWEGLMALLHIRGKTQFLNILLLW